MGTRRRATELQIVPSEIAGYTLAPNLMHRVTEWLLALLSVELGRQYAFLMSMNWRGNRKWLAPSGSTVQILIRQLLSDFGWRGTRVSIESMGMKGGAERCQAVLHSSSQAFESRLRLTAGFRVTSFWAKALPVSQAIENFACLH